MWNFVVKFCFVFVLCVNCAGENDLRKNYQAFTIEQLVNKTFPRKTSTDQFMNPCKASRFIGDIALPDSPLGHIVLQDSSREHRQKRAAIADSQRLWENGVVPYEIEKQFDTAHRTMFKQAMRHWENFTCIQFVERDEKLHDSYIVFNQSSCGCCSYLGRQGQGGQGISIGPQCNDFGVVVHELGHALGFWHEHSRPDRDEYVYINKQNIQRGREMNFVRASEQEINSLGFPYDYHSIMHYAENQFSKKWFLLKTIEPIQDVDPSLNLGQRLHLSDGDVAQTNALYRCPKCGRTYQSKTGKFASSSFMTENTTNQTCEWRISATHGEAIYFNITSMDIKLTKNCQTDYVEIRDGYWDKSPLLGRFCGTSNPPSLITLSSRMLISYATTDARAHRGFVANFRVNCGGDVLVDDVERHLESPNYPQVYEADQSCLWTIKVPHDHRVVLRFTVFELEYHRTCRHDFVQVIDGIDGEIIGTYCGHRDPWDIIAKHSEVVVKFSTDESTQLFGFSARVLKEFDECNAEGHGCQQICTNTLGSYVCSCRPGYELRPNGKNCRPGCGGELDIPQGTITSPNFPYLYGRNKECVWKIVAQPHHQIMLNFTHFDLEGNHVLDQRCDYDRLEVSSALENETMVRHGIFCGTRRPRSVASIQNVLWVIFQSDLNIQRTGFAAIFHTDYDECSVNNGGCRHGCVNTVGSYRCYCFDGFDLDQTKHGCRPNRCNHKIVAPFGTIQSLDYPKRYSPNLKCVWSFQTTPGQRIVVIFSFFDVERADYTCSSDFLQFFDGPTAEEFSMGKLCGTDLPDMMVSSTNQLYAIFKTDHSLQGFGFSAEYGSICGGVWEATETAKLIYSHAEYGTAPYQDNVSCDWTLATFPEYDVVVEFLQFDLEPADILTSECDYDYVQFYSGTESRSRSYGKYCGDQIPFASLTNPGVLRLQFITDPEITSKGFILSYKAVLSEYDES